MVAIRELRERKGLTQKEVADILGVKPSVVSRYENGIVMPPPKKRKLLADILEVPESDIDYYLSDGKGHELLVQFEKKGVPDTVSRYELCRRLIISTSGGHCELCKSKAPFEDDNGRPYLEIYVIDDNFKDDAIEKNLVALCPNCYKKMEVKNSIDDRNILINIAKEHTF